MAKTRILHIIKSLGRGGAEMLLPETLKLHNKEVFEFHYIYFLPWKDQMVENIHRQGGLVSCLASSNNIQLMMKVKLVVHYVRKNNIQLIHAHLPWAGILARFVGKITGVPIIYTEHNKQERYHFATRFANMLTMNWLSAVVAVSDDVEQSIRSHKRQLKPDVLKIVNGVNTDHFKRGATRNMEIREHLKIPSEALVVGTVSVFRFQKRLDLWIELAAKIRDQIPSTHFIIVGDGPLREELIQKREALGLKDRIHMPGLETDVRPYLAAFDLYMMTSIFEGLPVALLEAMSMECPPIATNAGGIKEVVQHEVDGLLCSVNDPEKLVGYAVDLLRNPSLRETFAVRARERVLKTFSMNKMVLELETVYKAMLGKRRV